MPLPTITVPNYELILPSNDKKIKYRPFLVKEEKILLLAQESKDNKQITLAIKQILKDCIVTRGVKIEDLPTFDIEYLFLRMRAKAVGESVDLIVTCGDDGKTEVPVKVFIDEIEVQKNPEHSRDIPLDDKLILRMKYPSLEQFIENNFEFEKPVSKNNIDKSYKIISDCMDVIYSKEESWSTSDVTEKERMEFIDRLSPEQFLMIEKFFQTMPVLSHTIKVTNPNTKVENEVVLRGLSSFFI
jgi:hypothetical protein